MLEEEMQIKTSFVRLGKRQKSEQIFDRWFRRKQKERNRIEGNFGNGKEHYRLDHLPAGRQGCGTMVKKARRFGRGAACWQ